MVESDLNLHKNYMAMKSTWNRTCFPNPPGCCMYRLPYEQVGPDIKGSRWVAFLLSVSWNWHLHTASGHRVLILFISHCRGDGYRQCLCLEQSKIRQTSSGRVVMTALSPECPCKDSLQFKTPRCQRRWWSARQQDKIWKLDIKAQSL